MTPARDPLDVLADVAAQAQAAIDGIAKGTVHNGRGALQTISTMATDTIRHHAEDAAAAGDVVPAWGDTVDLRGEISVDVRNQSKLSAAQDRVAELLTAIYGGVAIEHADAGRVVLRGITRDIEREILTVDRKGIEDGGQDAVLRLTMRRDRLYRARLRGEHHPPDFDFAPEDDGCEQCGDLPPAYGCDVCGAVPASPTGPVA